MSVWFAKVVVIAGVLEEFSPFGSVAEHSLGKGEVPGPIPGMGTMV